MLLLHGPGCSHTVHAVFVPDGMHAVPQNGLNIGIVGSFIDIEPLNLSFDEIDG